jgi:signal transduction histidine kinase
LGLLVVALGLPLNLIVLGAIWGLLIQADDAQRQSLLYAARSIAAAVDAELGKYTALAQALARSPASLDNNLEAFEAEARRAFPPGEGAWVLLADVNGQQLLNTLSQPGDRLPRLNLLGIEAQQRAFAARSVVVSDVLEGRVAQEWVVHVDIPIFVDDHPFRGLVVGIRHKKFRPLLSGADIPGSWVVAIIDGQGRYIARVPGADTDIGQLASQGWRAIKDRTGLFEFPRLEGEPLIHANAHPSLAGWSVGVAVKKAELQAAAWNAVRWEVILGPVLSAASLLLAGILARQITRPINQLRESFAVGPARPIAVGPPEIIELQDALYRASIEREKASRALMAALSKLKHEMAMREEAQAAHAQSQRMEAIGQLAGGIAHDSNNVLAAISSYLDAVTLRSNDEKIRKAVQGAMDTIQMGASLNRRLLSFSRRHGVGLERIDLNDRVRSTVDLLQRTLGDQVTVTLRCSAETCPILANTGDLDNAILNLAINARDAMPKGGLLTIETRHVTVDAEAAARIPNARPGDFVRLTVRDTGQGMTTEVLRRAMEPFFTTKEQGTGLGLPTIYGVARQSGGFVAIDSAVGLGTTVHLYLPKSEPELSMSRTAVATQQVPLGDGERILVVEDNDEVREATVSRVDSLGYTVVQARTGSEAITLLEAAEPIALVFSDVVMPAGMTGYDLAEWIRSRRPNVKVLLTSGYSDASLAASEAVRQITVLGKPYTREQLAYALREALNR